MKALAPLKQLYKRIRKLEDRKVERYMVPGRWLGNQSPEAVAVQPYQYWAENIGRILDADATPLDQVAAHDGDWSRNARVYNLFIRSALAFDHNGDGNLDRPNEDNLTETGTFVKAICLLPYIKSLGCNTIHLLPITAIGKDGCKGNAGSPYAIRNPYQLDKNLAEPSINLPVEAQFAAFVSAAHHLGIRIICEFIFRVASKDADAIKEHPDWFYWIDAKIKDRKPGKQDEDAYGNPLFTDDEAAQIIKRIEEDELLADSIPPHKIYRDMFLEPPKAKAVKKVRGSWRADYPDKVKGRIPGAFTDWPLIHTQPPWGDITYLRLYDSADFNYIAYNTIRKYDPAFAKPENRVTSLWDYISNIVPHFQNSFGIDGAVIDMGHSLPPALKKRIIDTARVIDSNFAFWDENFVVAQASVDEGFNAVMGSLPLMLYQKADFSRWLDEYMCTNQPLPLLGAVETHNTPRAATRAGGELYSKFAFVICTMLPSVPFVHNGFEFAETLPINTGLDFSAEQVAIYQSDKLPLFNAIAYDWTKNDNGLQTWVQKCLHIRAQFSDLLTDSRAETMGPLMSDNPAIRGILRRTPDWSQKLGLIYNDDMENFQSVWMPLPTGRNSLVDLLSEQLVRVSNSWFEAKLPPGGVLLFEL